MKISFQNPTRGPLITVSFEDNGIANAFSVIGASRVAKAAGDGLSTLRTAAQFAEAAPGAAGGGAGVVGTVGPLALIGMLFAAGDTSRPTYIRSRTPAIDRPPIGLAIPQWIADMESSAQLAIEIHSIQHQIQLMKRWGLGHLTFALQQRLDNLTTQTMARTLRATASAKSGDTSTSGAGNSITQVERNVRHAKPLEWFNPSRRAALLINLQDYDRSTYSWNPIKNSADRHLADLEIALLGRFGALPTTNTLSPSEIAEIQGELQKTEAAYNYWAREENPDIQRRSKAPVEMLTRILPDQDFESTLVQATKDISADDPQQLIYVVIAAHGISHEDAAITHNALSVGGKVLLFSDLIGFLDTVPGKKVVILSSCYSGNFVEHIARHSRRTDYAVIADTSVDEVSRGINQMCFVHELAVNIIHEGPLSRIRWDSHSVFGEKQTPTIFMGFDAVL